MCSNLLQINIRIYQALGLAKLTERKNLLQSYCHGNTE
jgi:hypothetical protein